MIRTESKQIYLGESMLTHSFYVPSFSVVKKIYLVDNILYMIVDYPDIYGAQNNKTINLKIRDWVAPTNEFGYEYFDTQIVYKTELVNSSYNSNIQFTTTNLTMAYHFFIQEIKPPIEMRDDKIETLIND